MTRSLIDLLQQSLLRDAQAFLPELILCGTIVLLLLVRLFATTEELFFRGSYHDNYVPEKVRQATWHW